MATGNTATKEKEHELVLTLVFDAPRELLFKVWTDPKHVSQWWDPGDLLTRSASWTYGPEEPFLFTCAAPTAFFIP